MEKNNLDKLFQEKLKDLKVSAPKDAWEAVVKKLEEKKKRRTVVLWWSVAAMLLVLLTSHVFYRMITENTISNTPIVETENKINNTSEEKIETTTEKSLVETKLSKENYDPTRLDKNGIDNILSDKSLEETSIKKIIADKETQAKTAVASEKHPKTEIESETIVSQSSAVYVKEKETPFTENTLINNAVATQDWKKQKVAESEDKEQLQEKVEENSEKIKSLKTISEESTLLAIEDNSNQKDTPKKEERWSIGAQVAPVYYNSVNGGSSLDNQFNDSGNEGGINMSLGLQVAYQVNDKWQLRSGVHRMNVGYATNNVQVGYSTQNLAISNINYRHASGNDIVVTAFSNDNLSDIQQSQYESKVEVLYIEGDTQLKQAISYIEVPVEIERKIIHSDFEWSIIGGVSSLFLTGNDVYVKNNKDYSYPIGSANNLEKTSFTTNIGMGFGYNFSKRLHLKLEPMFKYQWNAYTKSVDFKPYIFGVYTGVNFKLDGM